MSFKYLICLDFEATCWPGYGTRKEDSEIIEIGAVLLNASTGEVEDKFHQYVRPTRFPQLSEYCIELTGITQSMVDHEEPFPTVYLKFQNWIQNAQHENGFQFATPMEKRASVSQISGPNATFCTWSAWDLKFYFKLECERAAIVILPHFKAWIDARCIYKRKYTHFGVFRFSDALKRANITTVGHEHSAIFDATNMAKLIVHLIKNGIQCFQTTDCYY